LLGVVTDTPWTFEPANVVAEIAATVPAYAGITLGTVGPLGRQLATAAAPHAGAAR